MRKYNISDKKKYTYILSFIIVLFIAVLMLPICDIKTITINNNQFYSDDEIIKKGNLSVGMNIFSISKRGVIQSLNELPFVSQAELHYKFPGEIIINIEEVEPIGYVPFSGTYLCIDIRGYVLQETTKKILELPTIEGLLVDSFKINSKLSIKNEDAMLGAVDIVRVLNKYEFTNHIDSIDISDMEQIHLYVDNLDVIIGTIKDLDIKVQWLIKVQGQYVGTIDLSNVESGQVVLKPLT